jgi:hypothetical protein
MEWNWIYVLILVGLVFWLSKYFNKSKDIYLETFRPLIHKILIESGFPLVSFELKSSKYKTFTKNKRIIYLVTKNQNENQFNSDTLLFVLLHEIAHILSFEQHHTSLFYDYEKKLYQTAIQLGYLNLNQIDKSYPCFG